jgi:hypothetical protein
MEQDKFSADKAAAIIPHGIGHISAVGRSSGLAPEKWPPVTTLDKESLKLTTFLISVILL